MDGNRGNHISITGELKRTLSRQRPKMPRAPLVPRRKARSPSRPPPSEGGEVWSRGTDEGREADARSVCAYGSPLIETGGNLVKASREEQGQGGGAGARRQSRIIRRVDGECAVRNAQPMDPEPRSTIGPTRGGNLTRGTDEAHRAERGYTEFVGERGAAGVGRRCADGGAHQYK